MELNKNEKIMKIAGLLYAVSFITTALIFIFAPELLFQAMNDISAALFRSLPPADDSGKFWLSMTVSMMAGVAITSLLIYKDVKKYFIMAIPLCGMKFTSALMGLSFFVVGMFVPETKWNSLANAAIFLTDFPLGLFMLLIYRKIKNS